MGTLEQVNPGTRMAEYNPELVGKWLLDVQSTRNGVRYGASNRDTVHDSQEKARLAAGFKLAAQRKQYARKYPQAVR